MSIRTRAAALVAAALTSVMLACGMGERVTAPELPAASLKPQNVRAVALSPWVVRVEWDAPSGVAAGDDVSYRVYRGGAFLAGTSARAYEDSALTPSTWYMYTVTLVHPTRGESEHASDDVTTLAHTAPTLGVTPSAPTITVGQGVQLTAAVTGAGDGATSTAVAATWTTSSAQVATVSGTGMVTGTGVGQATITAQTAQGSATAVVTVSATPVASVVVTAPDTTVQVGSTVQFTAVARDAAGNPLAGRPISWSSGDWETAMVSSDGVVMGRRVGVATITASSGGASGTARATVVAATTTPGTPSTPSETPAATVTVTGAPTAPVVPGDSATLAATVRDASGNVLAGRAVTWATSDAAVATVSGGVVRTHAPGTATITATSGSASGSATVTVAAPAAPAAVATLTITPSAPALLVGGTTTLTAEPRAANGTLLAGRAVTWSSSDAAVATVSGGVLTGLGAGTATITATSEGVSATATATVTAPPPAAVASITLSPSPLTITAGQEQQVTATPRDANGTALTGRTVTWSSSNAAAATVSAAGKVTAVAAGSATITATSEGVSATLAVTVQPKPVATIAIVGGGTGPCVGNTLQLSAEVRAADGTLLTDRPVTWASSNPLIGGISVTGVLSGLAVGSTTVTATAGGQTATVNVSICLPVVATVTIAPTSVSLNLGLLQLFAATARDANGNVITGRAVTWTSSNPLLVSVNAGGQVLALALGNATITATVDGVAGTATVSVLP